MPLHLINCPFCGHQDHIIIDVIDFNLKGTNVQGTYYCSKCDKHYHTQGHIRLVESKESLRTRIKQFFRRKSQ